VASKSTISWALASSRLRATPSSILPIGIWRMKAWCLRCPLALLAIC
jgi:hypothetical protein